MFTLSWRFHFELRTHQMFSVHTTPEKIKNVTITGHFGFVFEDDSVREITWLLWRHRFRKDPFSKCFPSTALRRKAGVLEFLRFRQVTECSVNSKPNRRNKAAFFLRRSYLNHNWLQFPRLWLVKKAPIFHYFICQVVIEQFFFLSESSISQSHSKI